MEEEKKVEVISEQPIQEPVQVQQAPVVEQAVKAANVAEKTVQQTPALQPQQETVTYDKSLYDPDYEEKSGKGIMVVGIVIGIVVVLAILAITLLPMLFSSKNSIRKTDGASEMITPRERVESVDVAN